MLASAALAIDAPTGRRHCEWSEQPSDRRGAHREWTNRQYHLAPMA